MKIIRADNGASIDVNFPSNATVDHIKQKAYENYNIPIDQQILLYEGTKLPAQKTFAELGLTQDKQIFLYDKRQLGIDSAPPSETYYEIPLINLPEQPVFAPNAADPIHVRNLKQYEQKFSYQYNIAKAILDSSDASLRLIIQSHFEQQNQLAAIRSAIANLNDYDKKLLQIFDPFTEYVSRKQDEHAKLFKSMDSTLQKLRETKLDPVLCDDHHKALIDFIPVDKLRDWAKRCKEQDDLLRWKFSELTRSIRELDQNVKLETDRQMDFDIKQQQETLKSSSSKVEEIKAITSAFWNDLQKLQNVLKVTMQSGGNVSDDMYDGFKAIITAHTNNLVFLNNTHREITDQLKAMAQSKTNLSRLVHERLKGVSSLQSKITTVQHKIAGKDGFRAMLLKHKKDMFQLVYLECLAPAYDSYVHEIKRRRSWHRKLLMELQKLRLRLENITSNERKQREKYITEYGIYIPKELITRLPAGVPGIHIDMDGADEDLPEVEGDFSVDLDWRSNFFGNASDMNLDEEMRKMQLESKAQSPSSAQQSQLAFSASISEKLRTLQDELERKRKEAKNYKRRVQELETKVSISAFAQSHSPSHSSNDSTKLLESQNNVKRLEDQVQKLESKLKDTEVQYQSAHTNLEEELKKKNFVVSKIEEDVAQTNEIILDLRKELQEKQSEANTAKSKVAQLEQEIRRLTDQLQSHDLKTSELSQQISDADMDKKVIAEEKRSFVQQITELSKQKVVLSEKVDQIQKLLSVKQAKEEQDTQQMQSLKQQIEDLKLQLQEVTKERDEKISMQDQLLLQLEKEKQTLSLLEQELKESKEREQQVQKQVQELSDTIAQLEVMQVNSRREKASLVEEIAKLNEQVVELRSTVAQFKESKDLTEEKNTALSSKVSELTSELESTANGFKIKENSLHEKIEQMAKEQENLTKEFAAVRQGLEEQIHQLKSALDDRDNLAQSETSEKLREKQRSQQLEQEMTKLESDLKKTRGDLDDTSKQLKSTEEKYKIQVVDLEAEIKKKEDQMKNIQNDSQERFKALSQNSEKETQRLTREIEELREKLEKEVKSHAVTNADTQKKINAVEQEKNKSDTEIGKLKKANEALETEVRDLKNDLKKTKDDYEEYQHIVQSLQQDNQKLEENLLSSISVSEFSKKELQDQLETKNRTVKLFEETVKKLSEDNKNNNEELKKREATINSLKKNEETVTAKIAQLEKELVQFREGLEIIESTTKSSPVVNNMTVPERVTRILNHWDQTSKGGREIEQHMKAMEKALQEAKEDVKYKEQLISVYRQNSIAMNNFEGGCLVAFRPNRADCYEIWNIGAPNYYLNPEDEHIFQQEIKSKVVILGFIVALEKRTATEKDNPFKLPVGTDFHMVTAERLGDN